MSSNIGQDTIWYISESTNLLFVVVHLSNDLIKFNTEISALKDFCEIYPEKTIIIMGDYNAVPIKSTDSTNSVKFYSKDMESINQTPTNYQAMMSFDNRNVFTSDIKTVSTCKIRIITTQINKFLQTVSSAIDNIIIIEPDPDYRILITDPIHQQIILLQKPVE